MQTERFTGWVILSHTANSERPLCSIFFSLLLNNLHGWTVQNKTRMCIKKINGVNYDLNLLNLKPCSSRGIVAIIAWKLQKQIHSDSGRLYNTVTKLYFCNYANTELSYLKVDCMIIYLDEERLEFIQHEPPALFVCVFLSLVANRLNFLPTCLFPGQWSWQYVDSKVSYDKTRDRCWDNMVLVITDLS